MAKQPAERTRQRRSTVIILIAVSLFAAITILVLQRTIMPFEKQEALPPLPAEHVELMVFKQLGKGAYQHIQETTLQQGDRLAFRISTTRPIHVALAASIQGQPPFSFFEGAKIPPGAGRLLEKGGEQFVYRFDKRDGAVKFCLLYAEDAEHLLQQLADLPRVWQAAPASLCWQAQASAD